MQITNNYIQPSFKMAVKATAGAKVLLREKLNGKQLHKFNEIVKKQTKNPHHILIDTVTNKSEWVNNKSVDLLNITAGNKQIISGEITGPLRAIKKAAKYVNKYKNLSFEDVFKQIPNINE